MSELVVFTIRDAKAECYLPPFSMRSNAEAMRAFGDSVVKPGTTIHDHPEDFFLYRVGRFSQVSGRYIAEDSTSLCCGTDFVNKESDTNE